MDFHLPISELSLFLSLFLHVNKCRDALFNKARVPSLATGVFRPLPYSPPHHAGHHYTEIS